MPWAQPRSLLGRRTVRVKPGTEGWRAGAFGSGQHERAGRIDSPVPSRGSRVRTIHTVAAAQCGPGTRLGPPNLGGPRVHCQAAAGAVGTGAGSPWALAPLAPALGLAVWSPRLWAGHRNGAAARHGHSRLPGPRGPPNLETRMLGPRAAPADGCPDGRPRRRALSGVPGCLGRQRLRSPRSLP